LEQPVRADDDVGRSIGGLSIATSASLAVWKRESWQMSIGNCAIRSENVLKCCCASSVVGTRMATCLPSCTALNAARTAISVLP